MGYPFKVWKIEYVDDRQDKPNQTVHVVAVTEQIAMRYFCDCYGKENASRVKTVSAIVEHCHVA